MDKIILGILLFAILFVLPQCAVATTSRPIDCMNRIRFIETALELFKDDNGRYPTKEEGLEILLDSYLPPEKSIVDPWDNEFIYSYPGIHNKESCDIYSFGADGKSESEGSDTDDINNWDESYSWLYNAYGFITEPQAKMIFTISASVVSIIWITSILGLILTHHDKKKYSLIFFLSVSLAAGIPYLFFSVLFASRIHYIQIIIVPMIIITIFCLVFPHPYMPLLCTFGMYTIEFIVGFFRIFIVIERIFDGKYTYILIPVGVVLFGYLVLWIRIKGIKKALMYLK